MPTSVGPDGIDVPGLGWTTQSTQFNSNKNLESNAGPSPILVDPPAANAYGAWSMIPEDAIASNAHTSTAAWLTRVFVPANFSCGHIDYVVVSGSATNVVIGLYSAASFAVGPLAWTAPQGSLGSAGLVALAWNGTNSPTSVTLQGGQTYWVYTEITGTSPVLAGSAGANASSMNPNLTASATFANNSLTIAAGPYTTLTATSTLTPQTTWANSALKYWFGLRA